jgi:hypothetical protein
MNQEEVVTTSEAILRHFYGRTEESHAQSQSRYLASRPGFNRAPHEYKWETLWPESSYRLQNCQKQLLFLHFTSVHSDKLHRASVFGRQSAERHMCGVSRDVTSPRQTSSPRISRVVIRDKWNGLLRPACAISYLLANCHTDMSPFLADKLLLCP